MSPTPATRSRSALRAPAALLTFALSACTLTAGGGDDSANADASAPGAIDAAPGQSPDAAPTPSADAAPPPPGTVGYYTVGNRIHLPDGRLATFNGINWFGFETSNFALHGLWQRSMTDMLDQIDGLGYDLLRIPYCNEMLTAGAPSGVDFTANPELAGLTPLQILDRLIAEAGARGIYVLLDRHRPTSAAQAELWYTPEVSEEQWIDDWVRLAERYADTDTVIGADLHNEPHGAATWGTGDAATDWRLAAERAGDAILAANPRWLIVVEGVENNDGSYWWGGNLSGAAAAPVRLSIDGKLVYSAHDYGPGVYNQSWFGDPTFPANLAGLWQQRWAYLHLDGTAPVLVGEFGGREVGTDTTEGVWQNTLVDYVADNDFYWTYWCWNPNSGDTGGLLMDDWLTVHADKQAMLQRIIDDPFGE